MNFFKVRKSIELAALAYGLRSTDQYKAKCPFIRHSNLSNIKYGQTSEEYLILKQWEILIEKVPIFVPAKFLKEIEMTSHQWLQKMIGAYLSQNLSVHHRCPMQLFVSLVNLKKRKGAFSNEEIDRLLEFYQVHKEKPSTDDWKKLGFEMGRRYTTLKDKIHRLVNDKQATPKFSPFNLSDDWKILEYLKSQTDISCAASLRDIRRKDLFPLANVLERTGMTIANYWMKRMLPTILSHLYGAAKLDWREEFFKYIIDNQVPSISDIEWTFVIRRWPFLTKLKVSNELFFIMERVKSNASLFEQLMEYQGQVRLRRKTAQYVLNRRDAIIDIYDTIRGCKTELKCN